VAAATVAGKDSIYNSLPWFWSDQYDVKLQIAGLSQGYDQVIVRGDNKASRHFAVFYLKDGLIIAVDAVNKAPEFMMGKRLITTRAKIDLDKLADETINIKEVSL
jgi:3-phenylpropionate/trans-cinnamate dioxygenase ferredoxin reductase subunit